MKRRLAIVLTGLLSAAVATVATAATVFALGAQAAAHGGPPAGAQSLGDPEYGVCRGLDPRCYHDWGNFDVSKSVRVLVYSRTAGPRHANLGPPLAAGLNPPLTDANVAQKAIVQLGQQNGFSVDWTEDVSQLATPNALFKYNAVIFLSTTRDTLDDAAQTSLRQYVRGGGGFVGIHNAFGTEYNWSYYEGLLGGANYYDHGPVQSGTVQTVDRTDSSTTESTGDVGLRRRVVQPRAVPSQGPHPGNCRRESCRMASKATRPPRPRKQPSRRLVPVLRRRPILGHHAWP